MHLKEYKQRYQKLQQSLKKDFLNEPTSVELLVHRRSQKIDKLLGDIWQDFNLDSSLSLVAVGGYGRSELHLYSDIDLLILIPNNTHKKHQHAIGGFLTFLWDIGLEVGHATRDIQDCYLEIKDLSVVTNLLESRLLLGNNDLFLQMKSMIKLSDWSTQSFFIEKQKEQHNRHLNFSNTAYNLEPNLKESPGGLRDIQTVAWVAKWYFDVNLLFDLVGKGYLNSNEYELLKQGQLFLWKVRFALHVIAERREDRLSFQYQKQVASVLGYKDHTAIAVEQLMKDYYQTVTKVSRLNDILLQLLEDRVLHTQILNPRFLINYGYIKASNDKVFVENPSALIEIFLLIAKNNYIRGISASTLRQMQHDIKLIDQSYHKKRVNNRLFIELLQQKKGVNKALKLMNRYGILERYIPAFGKITGLMQFDLFHVYTVDQHTLFVIRNLRRFFVAEFKKEFELCSQIATGIKKPELLFIAALFHDIAKGRNGDHAELGAKDALIFCKDHQIKTEDANLVSGLVKYHLLMSQTAQKENVDDTDVIDRFSQTLGSKDFLDYLYLLTVADIRATKQDLWNDWKDALLKKLYYNSKNHLESGQPEPPSINEQVDKIHHLLIQKLDIIGCSIDELENLLQTLPKDYFLRYELNDIIWHLGLVIQNQSLSIAAWPKVSEYGVVDIFIYGKDSKGLFYRIVSLIERLGLNVVDAKILTTRDSKVFNTVTILQSEALKRIDIAKEVTTELQKSLADIQEVGAKPAHRHFDHQIKIDFSINKKWNLTELSVNVIDKQGILSNIAYVLYELDIRLVNARIATFGERVEDVFFISNKERRPLTKQQEKTLKSALKERL